MKPMYVSLFAFPFLLNDIVSNLSVKILEPNHENAFWGDNYPRLLSIKQKYDPHNLLTGWDYVGFDSSNALFDRYNL